MTVTSELAMLFTTLNVMHSRVVTSFRRCSGKCTQQLHCYLLLQEYLSGNQITNQIAIQHKPLKTPSAASVPPLRGAAAGYLLGDAVQHLVHLHARGVPVVPEADDHHAVLFRQDGLVHLPAVV